MRDQITIRWLFEEEEVVGITIEGSKVDGGVGEVGVGLVLSEEVGTEIVGVEGWEFNDCYRGDDSYFGMN